jgi:DNA-binding phage protein
LQARCTRWARYLNNDEAIAEYLIAIQEQEANDLELLVLALDDVTRAKGMAKVARTAR